MKPGLAAEICFLFVPPFRRRRPIFRSVEAESSKSKLPSLVPQSQSGTIDADSDGVRIRAEVVTGNGEISKIAVDARFDGNHHAITGSPFADEAAYQRLDRRTIKGAAKKAERWSRLKPS